MSALLALTRREILDRRPLLWGALCAALIPILSRLQWWQPAGVRREYHETLAGLFGIAFPIALAIGLGASVIGEDLSGRRLGFYFSRPVSGLAIWASKTLAAILVTLLGWMCFLVPALLFMGVPPSEPMADFIRKTPDWLPGWIGLLVGLVFVAQAVAGAYRARDGLIAVDIAVFATLASAVYFIGSHLSSAAGWHLAPHGGFDVAPVLVNIALPIVALAGGLAAAAQVVVGRTDARRGHVALSLCLWGTLALAVIGAAIFSRWVLSLRPGDSGAAEWSVRTTASASHISFLAGRARFGYWPAFVVDTKTGDFEAIPAGRVLTGPVFSEDGRRAVWLEIEDRIPTLVLSRLDAPGAPIRSSLSGYAGSKPLMTGLSPDGKLAVVGTSDRLSFVDTDSGREAVAFSHAGLGLDPRSPIWRSRPSFRGDDVWLFFPPETRLPVTIVRVSLRTGQVTPGPQVRGSRLGAVREGRALVGSADGALELVAGESVFQLLPPQAETVIAHTALLQDGKVAALVTHSGEIRLMTFDGEGHRGLDNPLPAGKWRIGGEPRPGWLALGASFNFRTLLVEVASGAVARAEDGLLPAASFEGRDEPLPAGSPGSRLFVGMQGEVILLDPETGRREAVLVPPRSGAE